MTVKLSKKQWDLIREAANDGREVQRRVLTRYGRDAETELRPLGAAIDALDVQIDE